MTQHSSSNAQRSLSYKDAGVDIDAGDALVEKIKSVTQRTRRREVLGGLGGFGALCEIPEGYRKPVLVSATDGVGTKLKLAIETGKHDTIGIDLVAMCVNDLIVCGAEPLFFLDYYATGGLNVDLAAQVVEGIGTGCVQAGCALIGGETAEMPGMYQKGDYDLAGFAVGIVENLPRVLPEHTQAVISLDSWQRPEIFNWLQKQGNIRESEMTRTFNCGIGMIVCVPAADCAAALAILRQHNQGAFEIGHVRSAAVGAAPVMLEGTAR